jgi:hypothetical protein
MPPSRRRGQAIIVVASPSLTRCVRSPRLRKKRTELQKLATAIQTDVRDIAAALQKAAETAVNESKAGAAVVPTLDGLHAKRAASVPLRDFATARRTEQPNFQPDVFQPLCFRVQRKRSC